MHSFAIQILHCVALPKLFYLQIPSVSDPRPLFFANLRKVPQNWSNYAKKRLAPSFLLILDMSAHYSSKHFVS